MRKKILTAAELSTFSMELTLLIHAGYPMTEGLHLLYEESGSPVQAELCRRMDEGASLSGALRESGVFPDYLCHMAETGERTGRSEEAFRSLSAYYENRRQLGQRIRSALLYPAVLLLLMLLVIVVLLAKVLPVFDEVFRQLGGSMTGLAGGMLHFGQMLDGALPILAVLLLVIVGVMAAIAASASLREGFLRIGQRHFGDRGIGEKVAASRFAAALTMGLMSGLPLEEALRSAAAFHDANPVLRRRMDDCISRLEVGGGLAEALRESCVLPAAYCRMLALGIRSGSGDTVMQEISRRMESDAEDAIETLVSRVEPTMVLLTSLMVGAILLSVMLPLMNIMSAIG